VKAPGPPLRRHAPYSRYAAVYDAIGQRRFGERIADATLEWLGDHGEHPSSVLDLACGTGAATFVFAKAGLASTGVDRAPEMLAGAETAARERGLEIRWIEQDIRDLAVDERFDLIVSFFDSFNYLTEENDLALVIARAAAALNEERFLVFDLNTRRRLAEHWGDACVVAADRDDLFGLYRSWFETETDLSPLLLTFFVRSKDDQNRWERFDEEHIERAFDLDYVESLLIAAGFEIVELRAFHDGPGVLGGIGSEQSERVVFFARKRGRTS
jgi:SAM-dependent methyltransferase